MPAIGINAGVHPEIAVRAIGYRRRNIIIFRPLCPVKPKLEIAGVAGFPLRLNLYAMPYSGGDSGEIVICLDLLAADRPVFSPCIELVSINPNHRGWHPGVAPGAGEISDELK